MTTSLAAKAASDDPATGLRGVAALRRLLDHLEEAHVASARAAGWSWPAVAAGLGVSKQAGHKTPGRR